MSPQFRKACAWFKQPYNAFKTDVFALGAILYAMIAFNSPESLISLEGLDRLAREEVDKLSCSQQLKGLICAMMAENEEVRPAMHMIQTSVSANALRLNLVVPTSPLLLCAFTSDQIDTSPLSADRKILTSNFGLNQGICPLLILGSQGQRLTEGLIRQRSEGAEEVSVDIYEAGVYVWPTPLLFGPVVGLLLVLKEEGANEEVNRKVRTCGHFISVLSLRKPRKVCQKSRKLLAGLHTNTEYTACGNIQVTDTLSKPRANELV